MTSSEELLVSEERDVGSCMTDAQGTARFNPGLGDRRPLWCGIWPTGPILSLMTLLNEWEPGATAVTVWDLEMTQRPPAADDHRPRLDAQLMIAARSAPELSQFFYRIVGARWYWTDRLSWTDEQWMAWVDRPEHHLVSAWSEGAPAGYFELEVQAPSSVELVYFGLVPEFIGHGLGGWLLSEAIEMAWGLVGTERVWLHTCSLDGPRAMANYKARGFTVAGERIEWRRL